MYGILLALSFSWYIKTYNVDANIEFNGKMHVWEKITVDFDRERHHGIYRYIPTYYQGHPIDLHFIGGANITKGQYKYKVSYDFSNRVALIKIGDPKRLISGVNTYIIEYEVNHIVMEENNYQLVIWNVIGPDWGVPIERAKFHLSGPPLKGVLDVKCYTGGYGSREQNCICKKMEDRIECKTLQSLRPYQAFTVALKFPAGTFPGIGFWTRLKWFLMDYFALIFPILAFIIMFYRWYRYGRDPQTGPVQTVYEPPKELAPLEAGTLIDEKVDNRDITAEILDLALKGYLKITETPDKKDYIFTKLKSCYTGGFPEYVCMLMDGIFHKGKIKDTMERLKKQGITDPRALELLAEIEEDISKGRVVASLSSLKNKYFEVIQKVKSKVYSSLARKGYFAQNPEKVRTKYYFIAGVTFIIGWLSIILLPNLNPTQFITKLIATFLTPLIIVLFGKYMPRKTKKGAEMVRYLKGLKEFITRVEKDRLRRFAVEHPELFKSLLPYAIVFKAEKKWQAILDELYRSAPEEVRITTIRVSSFGAALSSMSSTLTVAPSSRGGGGGGSFAGGGAGGGGGGAW